MVYMFRLLLNITQISIPYMAYMVKQALRFIHQVTMFQNYKLRIEIADL